MSGAMEREFKLLLPSEQALARLRDELGGPVSAPRRQANHFFDTAARDLGRARIGLRLREEEGETTLTLKGPELATRSATLPSLASREEEELALDRDEARDVLSGRRSPLELLRTSARGGTPLVERAVALVGAEPLVCLGSFENERVRVGPLRFPRAAHGPELVFELDRTRFPGGKLELELELELPEGVDSGDVLRALERLFAREGIPMRPAASKLERFLGHLAAPRPH